MQERLLKKISRWQVAEHSAISELDINELALSIRDDLEKLYNTRRGTVLIDDNYGLQDFGNLFNGYAGPDVDNIQKAILNLTRTYEKRLSSINVDYQEAKKSDSLCFQVTASFIHNSHSVQFSANAYLHGDGSVNLET